MSALRNPLRPILATSCFTALLFVGPAKSPAQQLFIDPQFEVQVTAGIVYGTAPIQVPPGDFELKLDLYQPIGPGAPSLRPGLVVIHGGGFTTGSRSNYSIARIAREMASRGYTAVSIDYRLSGQHPVVSAEFLPLYNAIFAVEESPMATAMTAAVEDGTNAHRWMVANAESLQVDTGRIAVGGSSAGGFTSLMMAYGLDDHGIVNVPEIGALMDLWGWLGAFVQDMESGESPLIIVHGTEDAAVPFSEAQALADQASLTGTPYEFLPVVGAGHGFASIDIFAVEVAPGVTIFDRIVLFFYGQLALDRIPTAIDFQQAPTEAYRVYPIHPNPVKTHTLIEYDLPFAEAVEIAVFDVAGRLVRILQRSSVTGPGHHVVPWDCRDQNGLKVGSSVYYLRIQTRRWTRSWPMTVLR